MPARALPYSKDRKDPDIAKNMAIRLGFKFREGDIKSSWRNPGEVNVFLYHSWTTSMHWLDRIDDGQRTVHFTNRSSWPAGYWETEQRWTTSKAEPLFDGRDWHEWRSTSSQDKDSLIADPLFVDAAKRDFRLKPGSPAEKTGFHSTWRDER